MAETGKLDATGYDRQSSGGGTLKRTLSEFKEDSGTDWAAALTYYGVLSVFPALLALTTLAGLFGNPQTTTQTILGVLEQVASPQVLSAVEPAIAGVATSGSTALVLLIVGLVGALWSASGYVGAFMRAVMYYASPNAKLRGFKSVLPGAALALVVWIVASVAFAFYVAN
ncbi:MAG: YihY/virulence factor BrkB family protein, partial [Actinomycetota bacterium]|nr:YihY/virulence factor BrkB family protein [Actinomycetota bacterium]